LHAAVANQSYRLTVTALTDVVLFRINPADLPSVLSSLPQLEESLQELLNTRLGDLLGRGSPPDRQPVVPLDASQYAGLALCPADSARLSGLRGRTAVRAVATGNLIRKEDRPWH
jgi:CRP-like cAMP-binding protein